MILSRVVEKTLIYTLSRKTVTIEAVVDELMRLEVDLWKKKWETARVRHLSKTSR